MTSDVFVKMLDTLESDSTHFLVIRHGIWLISTVSKGFLGEMRNGAMVSKFHFFKNSLFF